MLNCGSVLVCQYSRRALHSVRKCSVTTYKNRLQNIELTCVPTHMVYCTMQQGFLFKVASNSWYLCFMYITLFRSMTLLCGTDRIFLDIPHSYWMWRNFYGISSVPQNIVMNFRKLVIVYRLCGRQQMFRFLQDSFIASLLKSLLIDFTGVESTCWWQPF